MRREVIMSVQAEKDLDKLISYLEAEWPAEVKQKVLSKLIQFIDQIGEMPKLYPVSRSSNLRKYILTEHTALYYRVKRREIVIAVLIDTRSRKYRK
jgi:plasmid stabilization system protein ParE